MTKEKHGDKTKKRILQAGVDIWPDLSLTKVAAKANLTHAAVLYHFSRDALRDAVAEYAVQTRASRVIVQLITEGHRAVADLSPGERSAHFFAVQGKEPATHN